MIWIKSEVFSALQSGAHSILALTPYLFLWQGGAFQKLAWLWLICLMLLFGASDAQVSKVPCNHVLLAKKITGYCIDSNAPNGICCMAVINTVEREHTEPCICNVIREGVKPEKVIKFYYKCGGKSASAAKLISLCAGTSPSLFLI